VIKKLNFALKTEEKVRALLCTATLITFVYRNFNFSTLFSLAAHTAQIAQNCHSTISLCILAQNVCLLFKLNCILSASFLDYRGVFLHWFRLTMRTNLPKLLDLLIFCIYSLNFSLKFFILIFFYNKSAKYYEVFTTPKYVKH
jgi:hypothetical protein